MGAADLGFSSDLSRSPHQCHLWIMQGPAFGLKFTILYVIFIYLFIFPETRFHCSLGAGPGTCSVDQAGLKTHRYMPASASQVLELKVCTTTAWLWFLFFVFLFVCLHSVDDLASNL